MPRSQAYREDEDMGACKGYQAMSGSDILEPKPCLRPVLQTVVAGCIHEHVGKRDLCDWHTEDVYLGRMLCGDCLGADGHMCYLAAVVPAR